MPLVEEKHVQAAFDYLNDGASAAAIARMNKVMAEHTRKSVRARLYLESDQKTQGEKNAAAECHPEYLEACQAEAEAVRADEWHRHQKARADAIISAWRTERSDLRGAMKVA
jgi:hypothetical protein